MPSPLSLTPLAKWFTIPYIIFGVAMLGVFIQLAGKAALESLQETAERRGQRIAVPHAKNEES